MGSGHRSQKLWEAKKLEEEKKKKVQGKKRQREESEKEDEDDEDQSETEEPSAPKKQKLVSNKENWKFFTNSNL